MLGRLLVDDFPQANIELWVHELRALRNSLARRFEQISGATQPRENQQEAFYARHG
jgi:hypothetical protein